jgi:hypothetical protein
MLQIYTKREIKNLCNNTETMVVLEIKTEASTNMLSYCSTNIAFFQRYLWAHVPVTISFQWAIVFSIFPLAVLCPTQMLTHSAELS